LHRSDSNSCVVHPEKLLHHKRPGQTIGIQRNVSVESSEEEEMRMSAGRNDLRGWVGLYRDFNPNDEDFASIWHLCAARNVAQTNPSLAVLNR
jgi:hypothetical protein